MDTMQVLKRLHKETRAEVYLVGGYVRDLLRNKKNNDLDVVVRNLSPRNIQKFLTRYGSLKEVSLSKTNDNIEVTVLLFRAFEDSTEAQICLPRRGKLQIADSHNTLKQDAKFRDLRFNALYLPINYASKKDVIDLVGGVEDIRERRIVSNGSAVERFKESPIRMLRVLSMAARTGYTIDDETLDGIAKCAHLIVKAPAEAIRVEFDKLLMSSKPSKFFRLLHKTGLLEHIAPELSDCVGCRQDKRYHKYDVFTHLVYTADNAIPDLVVRLAGILHDIGKPATRREIKINGQLPRVTFHKHEMQSVKLAREFLKRLKYENELTKKVILLVKLHMYHYTRDWTDGAVRKFIKRAEIDEYYLNEKHIGSFPLFQLRLAERLGSGFKNIAVTERQKDFEARILQIYNANRTLDIRDLAINGTDIMAVFKLPPSKTVGDVLKYLLDRVLEEPELNERLTLLKLATEYIDIIGTGGTLHYKNKETEMFFEAGEEEEE